jgi:uncharacterized membrane protein
MAMGRGRQSVVRLLAIAAAVGAAVIAVPAAAQIQYLDNGSIRLGVDTTKGGAIVELRPSGTLASGSNVVNTFDLGREIQQSYYSGPASIRAFAVAAWWAARRRRAGDVPLWGGSAVGRVRSRPRAGG